QVAVETVDDDDLDAGLLDGLANEIGEFARRQFGRIDLDDLDQSLRDLRLEVDAQAVAPREQRVWAFVEHEHDRLLAAKCGRGTELRGDRGLPGAGAADD